jgi:hypothetical protein
MPKLLADRLPKEDSIRGYRAAARIRDEDARQLAFAGRPAAAVYLWGYVAEMTLKAAWFTLEGVLAEQDPITIADLRRAVDLAENQHLIQWLVQGRYHAIPYWALLLTKHRIAIGKPYPDPRFGMEVEQHSVRIYARWRETMRYKKNRPYPTEVWVVCDSVHWLLANSRRL